MISSHMLRSVAVCAFLDLRIPSGSGKITEKKLRTHQVGIEGILHFERGDVIAEDGKTLRDYITEYQFRAKDDQIHRFATIFGLDEDKLRNMMGLNLNEATINEFGRFDELKKSVDKSKAKAFFEAYEQTKLIPPKVNMKTDQLLRQFILTGGFEVDMP